MERIPEIKISFYLRKRDKEDFDRGNVTKQLGLLPTSTSQPRLSPGKLHSTTYEEAVAEWGGDGITVLPATNPPYQLLLHADWKFVYPKMQSWSVEKPLKEMQEIFFSKADIVCAICDTYNLKLKLIITIYANANSMPIVELPYEIVAFWLTMRAEITFDFYLD